jgi:hypothetical protein
MPLINASDTVNAQVGLLTLLTLVPLGIWSLWCVWCLWASGLSGVSGVSVDSGSLRVPQSNMLGRC